MSQVKVGQVWEDKDNRRNGRLFQVEALLDGGQALCKAVGRCSVHSKKFTKIRLDRFRPKYYSLMDLNAGSVTVSPTLPVAVTPFQSSSRQAQLATECDKVMPGNWTSTWNHVAELNTDTFSIVVRNFRNRAYDIKVMFNGLIVDTWVSYHLDLKTVLTHLQSKLFDMRDDLNGLLND